MSVMPVPLQRPAVPASALLPPLLLAVLLLLLAVTQASRPTQNAVPVSDLSRVLPLAFVPNAGQTDEVAPATERAAKLLRSASVSVKTKLEPGLGHEVPAEKMKTNYRRPLLWLLKD